MAGGLKWDVCASQYDRFLSSDARLVLRGVDSGTSGNHGPRGGGDSVSGPLCMRDEELELTIELRAVSSRAAPSEAFSSRFPPALSVEVELSHAEDESTSDTGEGDSSGREVGQQDWEVVDHSSPSLELFVREVSTGGGTSSSRPRRVLKRTNQTTILISEDDECARYIFSMRLDVPSSKVGLPVTMEVIATASEQDALGIPQVLSASMVDQLQHLSEVSRFLSSMGNFKSFLGKLCVMDPMVIESKYALLGGFGVGLSIDVENAHPTRSIRILDVEAHVEATVLCNSEERNHPVIPAATCDRTSHFRGLWASKVPSLSCREQEGGGATPEEFELLPHQRTSFVLSMWPRWDCLPRERDSQLLTPISVSWELQSHQRRGVVTQVHGAMWQLRGAITRAPQVLPSEGPPAAMAQREKAVGALVRIEGPSQAYFKEPFRICILVRNLAGTPKNFSLFFAPHGDDDPSLLGDDVTGASTAEERPAVVRGGLIPLVTSLSLGRLEDSEEVSVYIQLLPLSTGLLHLMGLCIRISETGETRPVPERYCVYCWGAAAGVTRTPAASPVIPLALK